MARVLKYELPLLAPPPKLSDPANGIGSVVAHPRHGYTINVTVLDTPDARLLRAGVVLAHRIQDGIGEWYLAAPEWRYLPDEAKESVTLSAELPARFATLVHPLRRSALLGPIAGLKCEHAEFSVADLRGYRLAHIVNQTVTLRRGGVAIARYREVEILPTKLANKAQLAAINDSMMLAGATKVESFLRLQDRLGAPSTGLSDFPEPEPAYRDMSLESFVRRRLSCRLRDIMNAQLGIAAGELSPKALRRSLADAIRDLRALSIFLEPGWREERETELAALLASDSSITGDVVGTDMMSIIDGLVVGTRVPKLGILGSQLARDALIERATSATRILVDRCMSLEVDGPDELWQAALRAAKQLETVAALARSVERKLGKKFAKQLRNLSAQLSLSVAQEGEPSDDELRGLSVREAFDLGMATALARADVDAARVVFVMDWPDRVAKLRALIEESK